MAYRESPEDRAAVYRHLDTLQKAAGIQDFEAMPETISKLKEALDWLILCRRYDQKEYTNRREGQVARRKAEGTYRGYP